MKKSLMVMSLLLCSVFMITGCGNNETKEEAYYEFGTPTTESTKNYKDIVDAGHNAFIKLANDQLSVCIYVNDELNCFKYNNSEEEKERAIEIFGDEICVSNSSSYLRCTGDDFAVYLNIESGYVQANDYSGEGTETCNVNKGVASCR